MAIFQTSPFGHLLQKRANIPASFFIMLGLLLAFIYSAFIEPYCYGMERIKQEAAFSTGQAGDFRLLWATGSLAEQGKALETYNPTVLHEAARFSEMPNDFISMPSPYPPLFLPVLELFAKIDLSYAFQIFTLLGLATLLATTALCFRNQPYAVPLLLGFGGLWRTLCYGQVTLFLCALYMIVATQLAKKPIAGASALALAAFKPHFGILVPLVLIERKLIRAFIYTTALLLLLIALISLSYGADIWLRYIEVALAPAQRMIGTSTLYNTRMASLFAGLTLSGLPNFVALAGQGVMAVVAIILCWQTSHRTQDSQLAFASMIAATFLAFPYVYVYDQLLLLIPLLAILRHADRAGWKLADGLAFFPVYLLSFWLEESNRITHLPLMPLFVLVLLWRLRQIAGEDSQLVSR